MCYPGAGFEPTSSRLSDQCLSHLSYLVFAEWCCHLISIHFAVKFEIWDFRAEIFIIFISHIEVSTAKFRVLYLQQFGLCSSPWQIRHKVYSPFGISNGRSTKTVHIRPYVGIAKMCLRSSSFFLKNCKQTAEKCKQIFEN